VMILDPEEICSHERAPIAVVSPSAIRESETDELWLDEKLHEAGERLALRSNSRELRQSMDAILFLQRLHRLGNPLYKAGVEEYLRRMRAIGRP